METSAPIIAPDVNEIDPQKVRLGPLEKQTWQYKAPDGKMTTRISKSVQVFYDKPNQKFTFTLTDVWTSGIKISKNNTLFMIISLSDEQSAAVTKFVETSILQKLFEARETLLDDKKYQNASVTSEIFMSVLCGHIVSSGGARPDAKEGVPAKYNDSIIASVQQKRKGTTELKNVVIEGSNGQPLEWQLVSGNLTEVVLQVDSINLGDAQKSPSIRLFYRSITAKQEAQAKVLSKRKAVDISQKAQKPMVQPTPEVVLPPAPIQKETKKAKVEK